MRVLEGGGSIYIYIYTGSIDCSVEDLGFRLLQCRCRAGITGESNGKEHVNHNAVWDHIGVPGIV